MLSGTKLLDLRTGGLHLNLAEEYSEEVPLVNLSFCFFDEIPGLAFRTK